MSRVMDLFLSCKCYIVCDAECGFRASNILRFWSQLAVGCTREMRWVQLFYYVSLDLFTRVYMAFNIFAISIEQQSRNIYLVLISVKGFMNIFAPWWIFVSFEKIYWLRCSRRHTKAVVIDDKFLNSNVILLLNVYRFWDKIFQEV